MIALSSRNTLGSRVAAAIAGEFAADRSLIRARVRIPMRACPPGWANPTGVSARAAIAGLRVCGIADGRVSVPNRTPAFVGVYSRPCNHQRTPARFHDCVRA